MQYNPIQVASAAAPSGSGSSSASGSWNFNPNPPTMSHTITLPSPTLEVTVFPPNYSALNAYSNLSNFNVEMNVISSIWLKFANGTSEEYQALTTFSYDIELIVNNADSLAPGNYTQIIKFDVTATDNNGDTVFVETKYKQVGLTVMALPELSVDNNAFNTNVLIGSSGTSNFILNVECSANWNIQNANPNLVFSVNGGVSGNTMLQFSVNSSYVWNAPGGNLFDFEIVSGALMETVSLSVNVVSGASSVSISELNVSIVNGAANPTGVFNIVTSESYTITTPIWLHLSASSGSSSGPISWQAVGSALGLGVYTGTIEVVFASQTVQIPVTFVISDLIDASNFGSDSIHFTRDNKVLLFSETPTLNTFVRLKLMAEYGDNESISDIIEEIAFINGKADFDLGLFAENFFLPMKRPSEVFPTILNGFDKQLISNYNFTEIEVEVEEVSLNTGAILNTVTLGGYNFVKGEKPSFREDYLRDSLDNISIYHDRSYIVNNVILRHNSNYRLYGNSAIHNDLSNVANLPKLVTTIYSTKELPDENVYHYNGLSKSFCSYSKLNDIGVKCNLFYHNKHNMPEVIACTGGLALENDFKYTSQDKFDSFNRSTKSELYTETVTVVIQTGYIPASEQSKITSMLKNKQIWMLVQKEWDELMEISLNPIDQKLLMMDSENNAANYALKFNMNKKDYDNYIYKRVGN